MGTWTNGFVDMTLKPETGSSAIMRSEVDASGDLILGYSGRLDSSSVPQLWHQTADLLTHSKPNRILIHADEIKYCDGSGIGLLFSLRLQGQKDGYDVEFRGLNDDIAKTLNMFDAQSFVESNQEHEHVGVAIKIGKATASIIEDFCEQVVFLGQLSAATVKALLHPVHLRWKEVWLTAEHAGANAIGIVSLIGFLFGLIMAFSSAMPMRQFGVDIYVADLAAIALVRVLGPFITAMILAGRSGSSFAAELGTMKINDEIDALKTMGLEPIGFLVVPKFLATIFIAPLLTVLTNLAGLIGSGLVILSLGFSMSTYLNHINTAIETNILLIGLFKSMVFGALIAGIGCFRGLQTKTGASAVGISTTRAVVSGIVLIVIAEGIFSVILHYMGI